MGEKNIKFYFKEIWCSSALDSSGSGQEPVVVSCGLERPRDKVHFLAENKTKRIWRGETKNTHTNIIFVGRHVELWEVFETL
jgi:hypothetical protein